VNRTWILLAVGTGVTALAVGCSSDRPSTVSAAAAPRTPSVQSAPRAERADGYQASGPLVVENQVDVAAQREGVVAKIQVDVGTRVRKGQLLGQLDDRQIQADREAAQARAKSLEAEYQHWQSELQVRKADLSRAEQMWKANLITEQQVEHDRYQVVGAGYSIERQRQEMKNAQATLRSLQLELEKTRLVAPFDGIVARRYVRAGQKVAANDRLFWVTATAPLNVKFTLPQEFAGKVKVGEQVQVSAPVDGGEKHAAKITLVSPVVDPASGTFELQAQVQGTPVDLRPGMTVHIRVNTP
jgi:membrane fusion protein, multidrug efflux system